VKQSPRNISILGAFALTCLQLGAGCSGDPAGAPIGSAGTFSTGGTTSTTGGTSSSGSFTQPTSGTGTGGTGLPAGGTFATAGTFGMAGTATAGTASGGTTAGGAGGASGGSGGSAAAGAPAGDFPASCAAPTGTHGGTALTRTCWGAKASDCAQTADNMNPPTQAIDAAGVSTRFATGAKMTASKLFTFEVDLGSAVMVNGVSVVSKEATVDFAPQLEVSVSMDGNAFTPVACGTGAVTTDFSFTATNARYVRLVQHGTADGWWSIHDLNVYAASGDTCAGGGTQMSTCTTPHTQ
jgi:hypothetical protein